MVCESRQVTTASGNGSVLRRQAIIWTNADQVHRRIHVAQGGDELNALLWYLDQELVENAHQAYLFPIENRACKELTMYKDTCTDECSILNTLVPEQNGHYVRDNILDAISWIKMLDCDKNFTEFCC